MSAGTLTILVCIFAFLIVASCARQYDVTATQWITEMDAKPAAEQVPHWPEIRALMVRPAPKIGTMAPDFALLTRDGGETVRLSHFRGSKPVVLIFGSWT